ncbi:conserved hypothetical protein [Methanocella arvoryzae MRE50]|uniref:Uncharacterized protein n=1 Tax=Methanocella arvoryzae (strain DSM 22066 / NBRC 105507 / MRE50) TaxID=351160 RepID=Q0W4E9_METAR|nr:conserved hypothetical protein [Methanocella arvoryzae MRE50]
MGFSVGRWTQGTCRVMLSQVSNSVQDGVFTVYSDGNDDYYYTLTDFFQEVRYGQLVKIREKGRVVGKEIRVLIGDVDSEQVETFNVENFNSILRGRVGRLVRKTKTFSKIPEMLYYSVALFQFYWNFMNPLPCKQTPATIEEITTNVWTREQFISYHHTI